MSYVSPQSPLRMLELFAGVGGFRCALEAVAAQRESDPLESHPLDHPDPPRGPGGYRVVWANQWEPGARRQWAVDVYCRHWGDEALDARDLCVALQDEATLQRLQQLRADVLVGGFPCQDYSVAQPARRARGIDGDKGQLWWAVHALLQRLAAGGAPVAHLMLENVDRLLASPAGARGRDFIVILSSLVDVGYAIEWRVINAAEYGWPQKRRRLYILAHHESTALGQALRAAAASSDGARHWLEHHGAIARGLPAVLSAEPSAWTLPATAEDVMQCASQRTPRDKSPFVAGAASAGLCAGTQVWSAPALAAPGADLTRYIGRREALTLGDIVAATSDVPPWVFIPDEQLPRWRACKGAKRIQRVSASGHAYVFSEGAMAFPDPLERPARTLITSEGGASPSRTTHVVCHAHGRLRRLTPEEMESLMGFARGHTALPDILPSRRAALLGNAVVVGVVRQLGEGLLAARAAQAESTERTESTGHEPAPHGARAIREGVSLHEA